MTDSSFESKFKKIWFIEVLDYDDIADEAVNDFVNFESDHVEVGRYLHLYNPWSIELAK